MYELYITVRRMTQVMDGHGNGSPTADLSDLEEGLIAVDDND